jgi:hypothetical protein
LRVRIEEVDIYDYVHFSVIERSDSGDGEAESGQMSHVAFAHRFSKLPLTRHQVPPSRKIAQIVSAGEKVIRSSRCRPEPEIQRAPVDGDAVGTLQQFLNFIASCVRFLLGIIPALLWLCCCPASLTRTLRVVCFGSPANSDPSMWQRATGVKPQGSIQDTRERSALTLQRMLVWALGGTRL